MYIDLKGTFLEEYFIMLTISLIMIVISIFRFKQHPRISTYVLALIAASITLSVAKTLEEYGKTVSNLPLTVICSFLGYTINPFCIFFFIMMSGKPRSKRFVIILLIPLIINIIDYSLMFIPGVNRYVVYFTPKEGGGLGWHGFDSPLRFFSHIISAIYLAYLIYISFTRISSKHLAHGLTIISCATLVIIAVVIESFFNDLGKIHILSTTIALSTIVYYLYLYVERAQIDALTGLFNRETYYHDINKMEKSVNGVIQLDMNGLKYINDNFGHMEGDKAIAEIANIIYKSAKRNMYLYRIGGDEFLVIVLNGTEQQLIDFIEKFKAGISKTTYHCSVGFSYRESKKTAYVDLFKDAEKKMYDDKAEFYKNSSIERRQV